MDRCHARMHQSRHQEAEDIVSDAKRVSILKTFEVDKNVACQKEERKRFQTAISLFNIHAILFLGLALVAGTTSAGIVK